MIALDSLQLVVFLVAAFAAAVIVGLAGFAFGIVAAGPWLHVLTPAQSTTLIVAFRLVVQGWSVWKLRAAIRPRRLLPFLFGSAIGVPLGVTLLRWLSPSELRVGTGVFLIAYALYALLRPTLPEFKQSGGAADAGGILGGTTGLAGIVVTIWCGLRGWPKDEQRAVFQPTGVATFVIIPLWLGGAGIAFRKVILLLLLASGLALIVPLPF